MTQTSGTLITRNYTNFRGVDFSNKEVIPQRSPDALNVWKNYKASLGKCIETRPKFVLNKTFIQDIYGIFFYKVGSTQMMLVHSGTKLYKIVGDTTTEIYTGLNPKKGQCFIYNNIWYYKDGINYLQYDGTTVASVESDAYVPTTSISRNPSGGGTVYEDVNMLQPYRKNSFVGDGVSTEYYLDTKNIDTGTNTIVAYVDGVEKTEGTHFVAYRTDGYIKFNTAPDAPLTDGQDNVVIKFKKAVSGYADRIKKCTLLEVFDNRVFFSGNQDYPNTVWHSSLDDPSYCSDLDYYNEGLDLSPVKSMVAGNNALWVFKEPSQANTTVFYHNPVIDSQYGKVYPSTHSSISTGCVATGINFADDICFFSDRGMEAISGDITTEQLLKHRSSLIDSRLLNEEDYENLMLIEHEGYLLVIAYDSINDKTNIYLADSREKFTNIDHYEYEWYYWELKHHVVCGTDNDGVLFLGTASEPVYDERGFQKYTYNGNIYWYDQENNKVYDNEGNEVEIDPYLLEEVLASGIYTLTNFGERTLNSYWTTPEDEFNYPQYQKTTNKRGCVLDMEGTNVSVAVRTNDSNFETIGTYTTNKSYVVSRIKRKKWKAIQLKISSTNPFKLYSGTLESYVGGYIKR